MDTPIEEYVWSIMDSLISQEVSKVLKVWFINHFFAEEALTFISPVAIFYDIHYPFKIRVGHLGSGRKT